MIFPSVAALFSLREKGDPCDDFVGFDGYDDEK